MLFPHAFGCVRVSDLLKEYIYIWYIYIYRPNFVVIGWTQLLSDRNEALRIDDPDRQQIHQISQHTACKLNNTSLKKLKKKHLKQFGSKFIILERFGIP